MKRSSLRIAVAVVVMGAFLIPAPAASAAACGTYGPRKFVGYAATGVSNPVGAGANIREQSGVICTGGIAGNAVSQWVMIQNAAGDRYSQAGYVQFAGSPVYYFSEYTDIPGSFTRTLYSSYPATGSDHLFNTARDSSGNQLAVLDGFTLIATQNVNVTNWNPRYAVYSAEAFYHEDDIPGTNGARANETDMRYQSSAGGTFFLTPLGTLSSRNDNTTQWSLGPLQTVWGVNFFETWSN